MISRRQAVYERLAAAVFLKDEPDVEYFAGKCTPAEDGTMDNMKFA